ncbi:long-chain fatty acid--CoA ligase (plasmid) [Neorhizobium sp. SOG26]|uniref:AMP-binding protein n=1 Tax=Neorhizobium sp. SOG26 TaxID=2060726 RepID=UPI000E5920F6|nr:AMP-binding protein [Neorhizobium sp. SOG26]AXV18091.1 long-chain fatty acid--CoA ligase [Neorhizobium sp. SOG26]
MAVHDGVAHWHPEGEGAPLHDLTVGEALRRRAQKDPQASALVFEDPASGRQLRWTYRELDQQADRVAQALLCWGVRAGDHVAVMAVNSPEWVLLEYGLARIGAVLVTINTALRRDEIGYILAISKASVLFFNAEQRGYDVSSALSSLRPGLPHLEKLCVIGDVAAAGAIRWDEFMSLANQSNPEALARAEAAVSPSDVAQIQFTSGTTGSPKGAMLRHLSIVNNANLMSERAGFHTDDRLLSAMPLFHTAGCVCNVLGMLMSGGCLVLMPGFDARHMVDLGARERITVINAVPTMYLRMFEELDRLGDRAPDLSSLRIAFTGGTSIPPEMMRRLHDRFGAEPMIIMGMTEASPIITQTSADDDFEQKISTAGIPLPHTELRIAHPETGATLKCGEIGELKIRGYQITAGYFDMPDATEKAIDGEGWLSSGDLAVLEADGHLRIVGRIKDMLIRGGENIYPVEIETFLQSHPDVADAYVVGVPDRDLGEEIFAFVKLRPGVTLLPEALRQHCKDNMSRQKVPRYIHFVETLPMTANGKVQKFALREMAAAIASENLVG